MDKNMAVGSRVEHDRYGEGIISKTTPISYEIFFAKGGKIEILKSKDELKLLGNPPSSSQAPDAQKGLDISELEKVLDHLLDKYGFIQELVPLGEKWTGGQMILQPANKDLKPKEIPIEVFFHKIVMLRDRLRVLEQHINSHPKLTDEEKVDFQQYITRIYGSLTTFNILFKEKEHYFKGTGE